MRKKETGGNSDKVKELITVKLYEQNSLNLCTDSRSRHDESKKREGAALHCNATREERTAGRHANADKREVTGINRLKSQKGRPYHP